MAQWTSMGRLLEDPVTFHVPAHMRRPAATSQRSRPEHQQQHQLLHETGAGGPQSQRTVGRGAGQEHPPTHTHTAGATQGALAAVGPGIPSFALPLVGATAARGQGSTHPGEQRATQEPRREGISCIPIAALGCNPATPLAVPPGLSLDEDLPVSDTNMLMNCLGGLNDLPAFQVGAVLATNASYSGGSL